MYKVKPFLDDGQGETHISAFYINILGMLQSTIPYSVIDNIARKLTIAKHNTACIYWFLMN